MKNIAFSVIIALGCLLLTGCPSKLPSDGRQVTIEPWGAGFKIKDGGRLLLSDVPRRTKESGEEILPVKAVVHKDVLYLLWEDDHVDKWENPAR